MVNNIISIHEYKTTKEYERYYGETYSNSNCCINPASAFTVKESVIEREMTRGYIRMLTDLIYPLEGGV